MRNAIRSIIAIYASLLLPHCPVTVVQRYRDGVCSLLFHLFFIICHPYISPSFRRNDFLYLFYPFLTVPNAPSKTMLEYRCKKRCRYAARGDRTRTAPLRPYATNLNAMLHSPVIATLNFINTRARGRSRRGTLSKMASFIVDSCIDQRFSLETWDGSKNDHFGSMHTSDHRGSVLYKN